MKILDTIGKQAGSPTARAKQKLWNLLSPLSPWAPSTGYLLPKDQKISMTWWIKNSLPSVLTGLCGMLEIFFNPPKEKELTKAVAKIFSKFKRALFTKKVARL